MKAKIKMEAIRLSKNMIKSEMRRQGISIISIPASEITKAAKAFLNESPWMLKKAKENIEQALIYGEDNGRFTKHCN